MDSQTKPILKQKGGAGNGASSKPDRGLSSHGARGGGDDSDPERERLLDNFQCSSRSDSMSSGSYQRPSSSCTHQSSSLPKSQLMPKGQTVTI